MKTKKFILSALTIASILTAAFTTKIFADDYTSLKCYDNTMYKSACDSTDDGGNGDGSNGGGSIIFPTGH